MKFFLIENQDVPMNVQRNGSGYQRKGQFEMSYRCDGQLCCVGGNESDKRLCSELRRMNKALQTSTRQSIDSLLLSQRDYGYTETMFPTPLTMTVALSHDGEEAESVQLQLSENGSFLKELSTMVGSNNVRVKATISQPRRTQPNGGYYRHDRVNLYDTKASTKEMDVLFDSGTTCEDMSVKIPSVNWVDEIFSDSLVSCRLTVEVLISHQSDNLQKSELKEGQVVMHKMLHDELHADVVIIPSNGNPVKCHKSVLSACSPVFETMFKTDMVEAKTHQIEMPDMTEDGVRSMLIYIYYQNTDGPSNNSGVAFELLSAAHKYDITPNLEVAMTKMLLWKPDEWFDLDVAVKLFLFARKMPTGEKLKMRAVQVLKRNAKGLLKVKSYKEMFSGKDPEAAMELNQLFSK